MKSAAIAISAVLIIAFVVSPPLAHYLGPTDHQYEWDESTNQKDIRAQEEAEEKRAFVAQQVCGNGIPEWLPDGVLKCTVRHPLRASL